MTTLGTGPAGFIGMHVCQKLLDRGETVLGLDSLNDYYDVTLKSLTFAKNPLAACEDADALLIATERKEFRSSDFDAIKKAHKSPLIFDGRNLYGPSAPQALGFAYFAIGRKFGA